MISIYDIARRSWESMTVENWCPLNSQGKKTISGVNQLMIQKQNKQDKSAERYLRILQSRKHGQLWNIPRCQSAYQYFESKRIDKSRLFAHSLTHGTRWTHQDTLLRSIYSRKAIDSNLCKFVKNQCPTNPCPWIHGHLSSDEKDLRKTHRILHFSHRELHGISTLDIFSLSCKEKVETYLQNCTIDLSREQVPELYVDKCTDPSPFQCWITSFKTEICSCSNLIPEAMQWFIEVEIIESVHDLKTSSFWKRKYPKVSNAWYEDSVCSGKDYPKSVLQKDKGQISSRKTGSFFYDLRTHELLTLKRLQSCIL